MNENHKELIGMALTIGIIGLTLFIIHRFIPSMVWAGIIAISTFPLYRRWLSLFANHANSAAFTFTAVISLLILLPLSWSINLLIKETQLFVTYLQLLNRDGGSAPGFIEHLPFLGEDLSRFWYENIGQPGYVRKMLSNIHLSLTPVSYYAKQIGANIFHRSFQLGFTLLTLFFFYRDGDRLFDQINHVGEFCLGSRWFLYADRLPKALRATVNGTIFVGIGVGLLMGFCYMILSFPAPALTGLITALAAMIPFLVPFVFATVALIMFSTGQLIPAIIVIIWGTLVMFVADHFVKPVLIGGAIQLPFLAVLFGILGGVETLGILGLFVGPIIMVLFITLWREPKEMELAVNRA